MKGKKFFALLCAAAMSAAVFAGCSDNDNKGGESETESVSEIDPYESVSEVLEENQISTETRAIADGDDYAINKINCRSTEDPLPGGYTLSDYSEAQQGKLYMNDKSKIVIRASNYKEDLQAMDVWADNACAMIKMGNMTSACDTVFEEPENVKVCGFDAIKYDYQVIQNDFVPNESDPSADPEKIEMYRFKARAYFFYSEQDAYIIMFDTREEDWDEQVANFEEFVADLEVTKTEY